MTKPGKKQPDTHPENLREIVLGILLEITREDEYSHLVIGNTLEKYQYLSKQDRAFISRVSKGTMEHLLELDYILNQYSSVRTAKMKPVIRNILRSAVYQLKYMDNIPDRAAINEAVNLAVRKGFKNLRGFVNGVLRNTARELEQIRYPDKEKDPAGHLSVVYSMPEWIVRQFLKTYGYQTTERILASFFEEKATSIRCNLNKISAEQLAENLQKEGIRVTKAAYPDYALQISGYNYIQAIPAFSEGLFFVQDTASMLVAEIANPKAGDTVIDVCAAPGGKSMHLADKLGGTGSIEARDVSEYKVSLLEENITRSGWQNIRAVRQDAVVFDETKKESADLVIADVPCSGLGVIGKKTDIKYKMTAEKQKSLVTLQQQILETVQAYVKPGGALIYSTCTIHEAENTDMVRWFTSHFPFRLESIENLLPEPLRGDTGTEGYLQLLPGIHEADGFFIARLVRS